MGYSLHIERGSASNANPITINEWKSAVASVDGTRLKTGDNTISNPSTGEVIRIPGKEGEVEVYLQGEDLWIAAITWFEGAATFRAPQVMDGTDPVWAAARKLATLLGAQICGDEGECYDLDTA
jgi:hypothetical protein